MGIIKWSLDAARSTYADQPKEILTCEGLSNDVLAVPATQKGKNGRANPVLSDGSVFNVGINQAALLIENGKVHDFVIADSEKNTGQYIYDTNAEPSLLTGGLRNWDNVWKTVKDRFSFGGQSPNTMNLVYLNLKEITGNPVGVGKIPFVDNYLNTRLLLGLHGYYTFRISNPAVFYENLLMDPTRKYRKDEITEQLRVEMMPKISAALAKIAPFCVNGYQDIYAHDEDLAKALNESLGKEWLDSRGIELVKVALNPELSPADSKRVMELENAKTLSNTDMAIGSMVNAQNQAMQNAAGNAHGAVNGFMGMNMAGGGMNASDLLKAKMASQPAPSQAAPVSSSHASGSWTCPVCGAVNTGKFCPNDGTPKPAGPKFCPECGHQVEAGAKFCPECGTKLG
ncbi:SPFH domain-containing protein [Erysipelotrichaceae bacterium 51-3]